MNLITTGVSSQEPLKMVPNAAGWWSLSMAVLSSFSWAGDSMWLPVVTTEQSNSMRNEKLNNP